MATYFAPLVLTANFGSSVAIVLLNAAVFKRLHFRFTTALTAAHYFTNICGLRALAALNLFDDRQAKTTPLTPRLRLLILVVGAAPALNNLSLKLNDVGFYQVVKLLVTPATVLLEWALYRKSLSLERALALVMICVGVGIASVNDVSVNASGLLAALVWVPVATTYKVLWSREAKEGEWNSMALMTRVLPLSTVVTALLVPLIDPPGLLEYQWNSLRAAAALSTAVAAFFVNWTGFLVMGYCSALTHTILGQLKACLIIVMGYVLLGQTYPIKSVFGAAMGVCAILWYTRANLREQEELRRRVAAQGALPLERADVDAGKRKISPPNSVVSEATVLLDAVRA